jgi:DNA-binding response OmpR family regulator
MARILVIDDEHLALHAIARMLAVEGHDVREAPDAAWGLRLWRAETADLVVTDIAPADMTGFEVIARLRAEAATVPIIVISGRLVVNDLELTRQTTAWGAVHLLAKPFTCDQLMDAVASALEVRS